MSPAPIHALFVDGVPVLFGNGPADPDLVAHLAPLGDRVTQAPWHDPYPLTGDELAASQAMLEAEVAPLLPAEWQHGSW